MVSPAEALALAAREHQAGRLERAEPLYRQVLEAEPENAAALYLLGSLALQQGRTGAAIQRIGAAARLQPLVPDFHATLAEAHRQAGAVAEAVLSYRRALVLGPAEALRLAQLGELAHGRGELDAAALQLSRAAASLAGFAEALNALGTVERRRGRSGSALTAYRRALMAAPAHLGALGNLGAAIEEQAGSAPALPWFERALRVNPFRVELHFNLANANRRLGQIARALAHAAGAVALAPSDAALHHLECQCLIALGRPRPAATSLRKALALVPAEPARLGLYGNLMQDLQEYERAGIAYERMLSLEPGNPDAHMALSYISRLRDDPAATRAHRLAALRTKRIYSEACSTDRNATELLLLMSPDDVNVPFGALLTRDNFHLHKLVLMDDAEVPVLPRFEVVFNGIGEPDSAESGLALAEQFLARRKAPSLNDPKLVRGTTRDRIARLLKPVDGALVPTTIRVKRPELAPERLGKTLAEAGLVHPVLIRPFGAHGGDDLVRVDDTEAMTRALAELKGRDFYVTQFVDFRSADGYYRKYRIAFVDGVPYPYHLAIYEDWKVHYYRTKMRETPWMKEEERRFLAELAAEFGPQAMAALGEIAKLIPLDYFGVDCSLTPDQRLLVFEANATMLVHLNDSKADFPYKHVYVPRIIEAFKTMVAKRAAGSLSCQSGDAVGPS